MNLFENLRSRFSPDLISRIARSLGLDDGVVDRGLDSIIPAVLGGVATDAAPNASTRFQAMAAPDVYLEPASATTALDDPASAASLRQTGSSMTDGLFGGRLSAVLDWLSTSIGVSRDKASAMMSMVAPVAMGYLTRLAPAEDVSGYVRRELPAMAGMMPTGLTMALGLGATGSYRPVDRTTPVVIERQGVNPWLWIIPLLIIAALVWWMVQPRPEPTQSTAIITRVERDRVERTRQSDTDTVTRSDADAVTRSDQGSMTRAETDATARRLPNGVELSVPSGGVEDQLIAFIEDRNRPVDDTTWFTFDRLEFDTGSATVRPSSETVLTNVAAIMKAYPNVRLKIGAYTDNVGDSAANLQLSQQRADATKAELVRHGVPADRLEAEGYGDQHPVADNSTEAGRQSNRRVDIRVMEK